MLSKEGSIGHFVSTFHQYYGVEPGRFGIKPDMLDAIAEEEQNRQPTQEPEQSKQNTPKSQG